MTRFRDKYRIESARLKGWDYAAAGWYFVTICTSKRACFFGQVAANQMRLTDIGETAALYWRNMPDHFPHVTVDEFVVMPDHIHGILGINATMPAVVVETRHVASLRPPAAAPPPRPVTPSPLPEPAAFGPLKPGSLSKIIQAYKAAVTHWCRDNGHPEFTWQSRFYDRILRDEAALRRVRQYIVNNPLKDPQLML